MSKCQTAPTVFDICLRAGWPLILASVILALPGFEGRGILLCLCAGVLPANAWWHARSAMQPVWTARPRRRRSIVLRQTIGESIVAIILLPFLLVGCVIGGVLGGIADALGLGI